jgi:hypothetical protein
MFQVVVNNLCNWSCKTYILTIVLQRVLVQHIQLLNLLTLLLGKHELLASRQNNYDYPKQITDLQDVKLVGSLSKLLTIFSHLNSDDFTSNLVLDGVNC